MTSPTPRTEPLRRRRWVMASALAAVLLGSLVACGASGGERADTTTTMAKTTTTEDGTTTTEDDTTTTTEDDTTTTSGSRVGGASDEAIFDFDDSSNPDGWDTGAGNNGAVGIEDGAYYTDITPGKQFFLQGDPIRDWDASAIGVNLRVMKVGVGTPQFGITCFTQTDSDGQLSAFYELLVSAEGDVTVAKVEGAAEPVVLMDESIDGFGRNEPFTLTLSCAQGSDGVGLDVRFNGEVVGTVVDDDDPLDAGSVWIETVGDPTQLSTVYFDRLEFYRFD